MGAEGIEEVARRELGKKVLSAPRPKNNFIISQGVIKLPVGAEGIEPSTSSLSEKRSTDELRTRILKRLIEQFYQKIDGV